MSEQFTPTTILRMRFNGERYDVALQCNYSYADRKRESRQFHEWPYDEIITTIGLSYLKL